MVRLRSLQDNRSPLIPPSGTAAHLYHQLEGALMGTEIREVHQAIGIQDTDHTDVPEIQTFREHLSSDQYLCLTFLKVRDDPLIGRTGTGGIEIQTLDLGGREESSNLFLHHLSPEPHRTKFRALAFRALMRQLDFISAIVAYQLITKLMVCQADIAIDTMGNPTALLTLDHRSESPTVLEQDHLLFLS